jgi:hypothetical protein
MADGARADWQANKTAGNVGARLCGAAELSSVTVTENRRVEA